MPKYSNVFVITYGRSGSTLLLGVLNSIDGYLIRGENFSFVWHLYKAFCSLKKTEKEFGDSRSESPTSPWYGASKLDFDKYLKSTKKTILEQLNRDQGLFKKRAKVVGFKEIRYIEPSQVEELESYIEFLRQVFDKPAFIFNTRNLTDVVKSSWWKNRDENLVRKKLGKAEERFNLLAGKYDDCLLVSYEGVVSRREVKSIFDFLGEDFHEEKVETLLKVRHSY
ncbi:hypothetical protein ACJJIQ_05305 [Microbulbifer sp. ANSA003]|uniref:hypothetical protein n=1 Tax=Microbulbifer sp. ANSA003 TaxID=3243360 RepID=UPI004041CE42